MELSSVSLPHGPTPQVGGITSAPTVSSEALAWIRDEIVADLIDKSFEMILNKQQEVCIGAIVSRLGIQAFETSLTLREFIVQRALFINNYTNHGERVYEVRNFVAGRLLFGTPVRAERPREDEVWKRYLLELPAKKTNADGHSFLPSVICDHYSEKEIQRCGKELYTLVHLPYINSHLEKRVSQFVAEKPMTEKELEEGERQVRVFQQRSWMDLRSQMAIINQSSAQNIVEVGKQVLDSFEELKQALSAPRKLMFEALMNYFVHRSLPTDLIQQLRILLIYYQNLTKKMETRTHLATPTQWELKFASDHKLLRAMKNKIHDTGNTIHRYIIFMDQLCKIAAVAPFEKVKAFKDKLSKTVNIQERQALSMAYMEQLVKEGIHSEIERPEIVNKLEKFARDLDQLLNLYDAIHCSLMGCFWPTFMVATPVILQERHQLADMVQPAQEKKAPRRNRHKPHGTSVPENLTPAPAQPAAPPVAKAPAAPLSWMAQFLQQHQTILSGISGLQKDALEMAKTFGSTHIKDLDSHFNNALFHFNLLQGLPALLSYPGLPRFSTEPLIRCVTHLCLEQTLRGIELFRHDRNEIYQLMNPISKHSLSALWNNCIDEASALNHEQKGWLWGNDLGSMWMRYPYTSKMHASLAASIKQQQDYAATIGQPSDYTVVEDTHPCEEQKFAQKLLQDSLNVIFEMLNIQPMTLEKLIAWVKEKTLAGGNDEQVRAYKNVGFYLCQIHALLQLKNVPIRQIKSLGAYGVTLNIHPLMEQILIAHNPEIVNGHALVSEAKHDLVAIKEKTCPILLTASAIKFLKDCRQLSTQLRYPHYEHTFQNQEVARFLKFIQTSLGLPFKEPERLAASQQMQHLLTTTYDLLQIMIDSWN
jgi:hypothetical protein